MSHLYRALASVVRQEQAVALGFGPHGLDQLVVDEANQPLITNSGDVIVAAGSPEDALGAFLLRLVGDSCAALGDATKRVLLMVLAGLRQYLRSGLRPHTFQAGLAAQVLECVVPCAVLHVPLSYGQDEEAQEALHALIATHLCGKAGGGSSERHLAACLHELVLAHLQAAARAGLSEAEALAALRDDPPIARLPGAPPEKSRLLPGLLLHEGPLTGGMASGKATALPCPTFLALSCPLEGEAITSVAGASAGGVAGAFGSSGSDGDGGGGGPPVAIRVVSEEHRRKVERAAMDLLRQRIACMAQRGVKLLLLCTRPPPGALQLCTEYGMTLVAGVDEQDVARVCAAGGTTPLARAGVAALAAAPLGRAAAARMVGLGPRRAVLLEFDQVAAAATGQAACTLLLCGVNETAVRQSVRAVRCCLTSVAAAVGAMSRATTDGGEAAAGGGGGDGGDGDGGGGDGVVECLVFVAGGGGFEALLELQLRELVDVAKRGPTSPASAPSATSAASPVATAAGQSAAEERSCGPGAAVGACRTGDAVLQVASAAVSAAPTGAEPPAAAGQGQRTGTAVRNGDPASQRAAEEKAAAEAVAAEARAASELLASLQVLHAMAAAVPLTLTGAGGVGGGDGPCAGRLPGVPASPATRRAQRAALKQIHTLRQAQVTALEQGEVTPAGLVVPSAALSYHGKALRALCGKLTATAGEADASAPSAVALAGCKTTTSTAIPTAPAAAAPAAAGSAGDDATAVGGGTGRGGEGARQDMNDRPPLGGIHSFVAANAVSYGVVEAASVVTSAWNHAVDILAQVIRIDGSAVPVVRNGRGGPGAGGVVAVDVGVAGLHPAAVARARRGGRRAAPAEQARGSGGHSSDGGGDVSSNDSDSSDY